MKNLFTQALFFTLAIALCVVPAQARRQLAPEERTLDTCPIKGDQIAREQYMLDQLPAFDSVQNIHLAWKSYRLSHCRFDQEFLAEWPNHVSLEDKGYSALSLGGEQAAKVMSAFAKFRKEAIASWKDKAALLEANGFSGEELRFSMSDFTVGLGNSSADALCGKGGNICYDLNFYQNFYAADGSNQAREATLNYSTILLLQCDESECRLVNENKRAPRIHFADPNDPIKGVSSGAGGLVKEE